MMMTTTNVIMPLLRRRRHVRNVTDTMTTAMTIIESPKEQHLRLHRTENATLVPVQHAIVLDLDRQLPRPRVVDIGAELQIPTLTVRLSILSVVVIVVLHHHRRQS